MRTDGFVNVAVRGDETDLERWRSEAKSMDVKLGDYLRAKIENSSVAISDRLNKRTARNAQRNRSVTP